MYEDEEKEQLKKSLQAEATKKVLPMSPRTEQFAYCNYRIVQIMDGWNPPMKAPEDLEKLIKSVFRESVNLKSNIFETDFQ